MIALLTVTDPLLAMCISYSFANGYSTTYISK